MESIFFVPTGLDNLCTTRNKTSGSDNVAKIRVNGLQLSHGRHGSYVFGSAWMIIAFLPFEEPCVVGE
jgi:hypothetical protein